MDSDPNARDESKHEQLPGEAAALNYIDKVHASLTKQWESTSRALTAQTVVSLLTVAVCIGAVTPRENFSLLGLGLSASINTVLIGSAFLIVTFHAMALGSFMRAAGTSKTLRNLYRDIGFEEAWRSAASQEDPLGPPVPLYTLLLPWLNAGETQGRFSVIYASVIGGTIGIGLAIVLPVAAELAALMKVASLMGWTKSLLWVVLVIPIVTSITSIIWTSQQP